MTYRRHLMPAFTNVPSNWIWKMDAIQEYGIPYSTLTRYSKKSYYYRELGQHTPILMTHTLKEIDPNGSEKFIFYERSQLEILKKIKRQLKY